MEKRQASPTVSEDLPRPSWKKPEAYSRRDETDDLQHSTHSVPSQQWQTDDLLFYRRERPVNHVDAFALKRIESVIDRLVIETSPVVLDLMAGWNSHWPEGKAKDRCVGLGLNEKELKSNRILDAYVLHDLNRAPRLPFPADTFDVVLNTLSVDYLIHPVEVFREVQRVLKPGGLFLVLFSHRYFPEKVVKIWEEANEEERIDLVVSYFRQAGGYTEPVVYRSKGGARPAEDRYAGFGLPGDPIYAVYAEKMGQAGDRKDRRPELEGPSQPLEKEELKKRTALIQETLACPYCGERLKKWAVPQGPFTEWDNEYMYICFNDDCPYLVRGWEVMDRQGNHGISYRLMYHPEKRTCMAVPVFSLKMLREGIVEEAGN